MGDVLLESLAAWWPELTLSLGALSIILVGVWVKRAPTLFAVMWVTLLAAACVLWSAQMLPPAEAFFGLILCDPFSVVFRWLVLGVIALVTLLIMGSADTDRASLGEYLGLLLLVAVGLMVMAQANHLLMAYVAMELVSLGSYALVGFLHDRRGAEASLKYLLFGALASGVMLFGMSLLFGLTGALGFADVLRATQHLDPSAAHVLAVPVGLVLVGLGFKISMVPFHQWTPDAYEGAPVPVTALLSVAPKAAGLALLLRLLAALHPIWPSLTPLVLGLTVATMTFGNVAALVQTNVKRLLAYSTIGQVGYLLIGVAVGTPRGIEALLVYLVAYAFMNLGAFACVVAVVNDTGSESIEAFRGLAKRAPDVALCGALFLLSLAGLPPLVGFIGKFLLFGSALATYHVGLALAGILNSAVALYYYVNIIRLMYVTAPQDASPLVAGRPLRVALGLCAATTLLFGIFPDPLLALLRWAVPGNLL